MADIITRAEFKTRQGITDTDNDDVIDEVITEATKLIVTTCGRVFDDAGSASARVFHPLSGCLAYVHDFSTTTGLIIKTDTGNDGTYATTWDAADFSLEPLNNIGPSGQSGWPYRIIRAVRGRTFPCLARPALQVTARWGWTAVPDDVKGAAYLVANRLYAERNTPFGSVQSAEFGALPIREQRDVMKLLQDYVVRAPLVA